MVTVSHIVKKLVDNKRYLQEALSRGIVSYNSVAKKLKPEVEEELGKEVKHSAIVMALRRYEEKLRKTVEEPAFNYFIETIMKTNICCVVIGETPTLLPKLSVLYHSIDFKRGGILNIIQGNYEVGVVTNERYKEKLLDLLRLEKVLNVIEGLVSISLTFSKDFLFTPGVLYNVLRFVAWENINVIDLILTPKELSLIVDKKDAMRCYKVLEKLVKKQEAGK